jgi:glutathione synthase/RimK-type ligase-like ATP-grasp enzyme
MILLCGIPSETPLAMVAKELDALGIPYRTFNQRKAGQCRFEWEVKSGAVDGTFQLPGESLRLSEVKGVYLRLMDDRLLPELKDEPEASPQRRHARGLHDALFRWCEVARARVVNRSEPQGSNSSKPYQAQLIARYGFLVPETLITNDPEQARVFHARHGKVIYKSISGIRSIVKILDEVDLARLDQIRWCPVQFQAFVPGTNIRVHTIGGQAFATAIESDVTDYRYAKSQGSSAELRAVELPARVTERCLLLAAGLDLAFAGIDLKITPEGDVYCFEVNPCPAYSYYEANTGQPIARAVAFYLAGN